MNTVALSFTASFFFSNIDSTTKNNTILTNIVDGILFL